MSEITVGEKTKALLEELPPEEQDIDAKIRTLIEAEFLRRLQQAHRQDRILRAEYGMSFDDFIDRRIVAQRGYTWEVERDAMAWETVIGAITMLEGRLAQLRETDDLEHRKEPE
jgi:hypothetical protein